MNSKNSEISNKIKRKLMGMDFTPYDARVSYQNSKIIECGDFKKINIDNLINQFSRIIILRLGDAYSYVKFEFSGKHCGDLIKIRKK